MYLFVWCFEPFDNRMSRSVPWNVLSRETLIWTSEGIWQVWLCGSGTNGQYSQEYSLKWSVWLYILVLYITRIRSSWLILCINSWNEMYLVVITSGFGRISSPSRYFFTFFFQKGNETSASPSKRCIRHLLHYSRIYQDIECNILLRREITKYNTRGSTGKPSIKNAMASSVKPGKETKTF
jgi:hypothetical protein